MRTFFFSFPRMNISLSLPEEVEGIILPSFSHSLRPGRISPLHHRYEITPRSKYLDLYKDKKFLRSFKSTLELLPGLEDNIESLLIKSCREWVAFHAGCVGARNFACLIAGKPESGKTTTTFNLVEMGKAFLCEEITPVDPKSRFVHPFPLALSMSSRFAREFQSLFPVKRGSLEDAGWKLSRYVPHRATKSPVPLRMIILPSYNPSFSPEIVPLSPGEALPEILECCFPPNIDEEKFFDSVIRIITRCRIFRLRTNGIAETRILLRRLFAASPLQA
jgi:hypothetical protein